MRPNIPLDQLDIARLCQRFKYLPKLLLIHKFQPFILVLDNSDLTFRIMMQSDNHILLILPLVRMESIVLRLVIQIIIAKSMLEAGNNSLEKFYVVVLISHTLVLVYHLLVVYEDVGNLLLHFCADLDGNDCVAFCFEEEFALAAFEETDICHLQSEVYFVVHARQKLVEFFDFCQLDFEHGAGVLQKLLSSFSSLMVIKADVTHTIFALFCIVEDDGD